MPKQAKREAAVATEAAMQNVSPGGDSLYFKNHGLFSDAFIQSLSSNDLEDQYLVSNWDTDDSQEFVETYEWMLRAWSDLSDILPDLDEAQLEDKWIRPILKRLGWEYEVQDRLRSGGKTEIPDYSLFASPEEYKKARTAKTDEAYFDHVLAVADAKKMGVPLDGSKLDKTNPSYQIVWYLKVTGREWGILTDGKYWRLYSTKAKSPFISYYEVNIEKFLAERDDNLFKNFFNFFRRQAFQKDSTSGQCFLDVVFSDGERYAHAVESKLRDRAFHLAEIISQGFCANRKNLSPEELDEIYQNSLSYLFRLLFILNCEAKGLLAVHRQSDYFPYSLRSLCNKLKVEYDRGAKWPSLATSYRHIQSLFDLLSNGDSVIGIHGFGRAELVGDRADFFSKWEISDAFLNQVLVELAFASDGSKEQDLLPVDYKRLSADHVGSIFEGLLEYKLGFVDGEQKPVLLNTSGERKSTGSFYTPDYVVDYVVKQALEPVVEGLDPDEILKLKVADPTMGSGHFLLGAVRYLEDVILDRLGETTSKVDPSEVRWQVLHSCIFGSDVNSLAVELAKFSLWMFTARRGSKLEPLDDQLFVQDSLIPKTARHPTGFVDGPQKYDAIVSNPPWDRVRFDEEEFFKHAAGEVGSKKRSKTKKADVYAELLKDPKIKKAYVREKSKVEARLEAIDSGYYEHQHNISESSSSRHIDHNLYKIAVERFFKMVKPGGRVGMVVPTGLFADLGCSGLRNFMLASNDISLIVGFAKDAKIFPISQAVAAFIGSANGATSGLTYVDNLYGDDLQTVAALIEKRPPISFDLIRQFDPNGLTVPHFEGRIDLAIVNKMYAYTRRIGVLRTDFGRELHQTDDAKYLGESKRGVRVLKGDEIDHFAIRPNGKQFLTADGEVRHKKKLHGQSRIGIRAISGMTDPRRLVSALVPGDMLTVNSLLVSKADASDDEQNYFVLGLLNSRAIEYRFRQISKNNNVNKYLLDLLPIPSFDSKDKKHKAIAKLVSAAVSAKEPINEDLSDKIDGLVSEMFGFTEGESKFLAEAILPFATKGERRAKGSSPKNRNGSPEGTATEPTAPMAAAAVSKRASASSRVP